MPDLKRLRLSSLDPAHIDADLLRLVETEERLMPHLHLSLQSGDDMILKRMRRRHSAGDAVRLTETLRRQRTGIALGADLIAGFPTETDAMFERTLAHIGACGLAWLHVFPYSARPGTPAARMPQLPMALRRERAQRLRKEGDARRDAFLAGLVGREAAILIETPRRGRTDTYAEVRVDRDGAPGTVVRACLTGHSGGALDGALQA
jgi:threonylcarbamoyladenosine tRNA methylthiotransferase MtaB